MAREVGEGGWCLLGWSTGFAETERELPKALLQGHELPIDQSLWLSAVVWYVDSCSWIV